MDFTALKQKINIKYFMVVYVGVILVVSAFALGSSERLLKGLLIVILYAAFDLLWTYARDRIWYLPVSSWISGFILSIVAIDAPSFILIILLPLLAVFSKQVLHFGKNRHIFNPASFGMAFIAFFVPSISWWGVAWSTNDRGTLPIIIALSLVGIFILWRQSRWHVTLPFLASYAVFLFLNFLFAGIPLGDVFGFLKTQFLDGTTIFFATVMLIEPLTSTFPQKRDRIVYGALVGFLAVLATYAVSIPFVSALTFANNIDPLVFGLLLGNLAASLAFLPSKIKPMAQPAPTQPMVPPIASKI